MNRYKLYMIFGICTLILSISGTFAYYMWTSNNNAIVNASVCTPTISFAGGSTINGTNMVPVLTKEEGTIKDIEVKKNGICSNEVTMNLYLELTTFPKELANSSFKYELYKNDVKVTNGNFSEVKQGDTITLISNEILNTSKDLYTLYIYIDGNVDNPIEMAGKSFLFKVWGSGTGAIYKENVITPSENPSSGSSKFFDTDIMRNQIETITIADSNKVPEEEGIVSKDISSNKDGTVMLWYKKNNNGNYDMWLGGENGVLQANTNVSGMFAYLTNIEKLDLSKLDTTYITNMSKMFYSSSGLKEINLSNFNTSRVTDMSYMFNGCSSLTTIDVSSFDTSKVTKMMGMFSDCSNLITLDLSNFDTSNVTGMGRMFNGCSSLTSLNLSSFNTTNVTDMGWLFTGCKNLISLDISNFDTSKVTSMDLMFHNCASLTSLDLSNFNTEKVKSMNWMFFGCKSLTSLNLSSFNTANVTNMAGMFQNCASLTNLDLDKFDTSKVTKIGSMFYGCSGLTSLDVSKFDTSNVTDMSSMFYNCIKLTTLNISKFNTSNVTNMSYMFQLCSSLVSIDLSSFATSKVTNMNSMFLNSTNLKTIYVSNLWNVDNVTDSVNMFGNCKSLVGATSYDSTKKDKTMANYTTGYLTYKANN